MLNVKIRLQGTSERLEEAIQRLGIVFDIAEQSSLYPSKYGMDTRLCYLKVYMRCPRDGNLYDFNEALKLEIQDLQEALGRLSIENESLKEQLGQVPKPRPYDAVLGTPHRQKSEPGGVA